MRKHWPAHMAAVAIFAVAGVAFGQTRLYWTYGKYVNARDLPDGEITRVFEAQLTNYDHGKPMYIDTHQGNLYWSAYGRGEIWTSGPEGQDPRILVATQGSWPRGVLIHGEELYWAEAGGLIFRADLDGQNVKQVYSGAGGHGSNPEDIEIYAGRIYWTSWSSPFVHTCAVDGTDYRQIPLAAGGRAFAVEVRDDVMYVAANGVYGSPDRLIRYSMDGQAYTIMGEGHHILCLDAFGDRIYYNDEYGRALYSRPLAGGPEVLVHDGSSWQFTVVPEPSFTLLAGVGLAWLLRRRRYRTGGPGRCGASAGRPAAPALLGLGGPGLMGSARGRLARPRLSAEGDTL